MSEITVSEVNVGYASVTFVPGNEAVPATTTVKGNVTTHTNEVLTQEDGFDAAFAISFKTEAGGRSQFNVVSLRFPISGKDASTPYSEIEREAVTSVAPILRRMADQLEADLSGASTAQAMGTSQE